MNLRRYKDILAIETKSGRHIAFHSRNLEVAEVDEQAWQAMTGEITHLNSEAMKELDLWNKDLSEDVLDEPAASGIRAFSINISQVCNLKCTYCGAEGDGTYGSNTPKVDVSIVYRQLTHLIARVPEGESFHIRFLGGEPLLYPTAIKQLANHARLLVTGRDVKLVFSVITNGTLVTPKVAELLSDLNCHVIVSLDGDQATNDRVRPIKAKSQGSSTALTVRGLAELTKVIGHLGSLKVNAVFGSHNKEVLEAYRYLRRFPFYKINLTYAANDEDEKFSAIYLEQLELVAKEAYRIGGMEELSRISQFYFFMKAIHDKTRKVNFCGAGKTLLQTDTKGDLYTCNWFMNDKDEKVGHGTYINEQALLAYQNPLTEIHNCQSCWARYLCGGGCMFVNKTKTGNKHQKDLSFCHRMRGQIAIAIEYYVKCLTEGSFNETYQKAKNG